MSHKRFTTTSTLAFMVALSASCALILSALASALKAPQEQARELYRSKQMLVAAQLYNLQGGYFQIADGEGSYIPAEYAKGKLVATADKIIATQDEILQLYRQRIRPLLLDEKGELKSFAEAGIEEKKYLHAYKKSGYYKQPLKLLYELLPNSPEEKVAGYIIPINGFGLGMQSMGT